MQMNNFLFFKIIILTIFADFCYIEHEKDIGR